MRGVDQVELPLSAREFGLLEEPSCATRGGCSATPSCSTPHADLGYERRSNVVEVYVRYLREKVDRPFGVSSIETVRGLGYRLREDGGTPADDGSNPC